MEHSLTKAEARTIYKAKRRSLSPRQRSEYSQLITEIFKTLDFENRQVFFSFLGSERLHEPNTYGIINFLLQQEKKVCVPKIIDQQMIPVVYRQNTTLTRGKFDLEEPAEIETVKKSSINVVLMPLLISDIHGNRVGFGGGYYDRFLSSISGDTLKIGLNFFSPIYKIQDAEIHDVAIDILIHPMGIHPNT